MKKFILSLVLAFSLLLASISLASADVAPNSTYWNSFNFPSSPYAQNGPGAKGSYCTGGGLMDTKCGSTGPWDIGSVFVTQDSNYIAWKFLAPNMSQAKFCNQATNNILNISVEFDADSNAATGCMGTCYPGSDYRVIFRGLNFNGSAELHYYNGSTFVLNASVDLYINKTSCGQPTELRLAINKSRIANLRGLMFQVEVKEPTIALPLDSLGTFGGDNMNFNNTNYDPLNKPSGCGAYAHTNASACINNTNGDSCKWDTTFNDCFPDFFGGGGGMGGGGMTCSQFCGICANQQNCSTNSRCQWNANMPNPMTGSTGACLEDSSKVITIPGAGSCDTDCHNCFTSFSCNASNFPDPQGLGNRGCTWINDSTFNMQWCEPNTFTLKTCGTQSPERCTSNASCATNVNNGVWDFVNNFCYVAGTEICFNGVDDNADNKTDCSDSTCGNSANCGGGTDTTSGGYSDPMEAMKQRMSGGMMSPPTRIGDTSANVTTLAANYSILDILGFSIADMGSSIGMGAEVRSMAPSAFCLAGAGNQTPGTYYYLIDTDANVSTGCNANISSAVSNGYEYEVVYQIGWNGTNYTEVKKGYRCIPSTGNFSLFPAQLTPPPTPPDGNGPNYIQCSMANAAIIAIAKTDIGNPKGRMRFSIATAYNDTNLSNANDSLTDLYYKPGTIDFRPTDCFSNPTACGSKFSIIGGGKFMPFQDCMTNDDTDGNSLGGCADPFCRNFPRCTGASDRYNLSNDKDAPTMISTKVETFPSFAFVNWITDEPSNGTVRFYNRSTTCTGTYTEKADAPPFEFDRYRPFHGMPMDEHIWGFRLSSNLTYYYKLYSCDQANNCGLSACLNFTTKGASESSSVQFKFEFASSNDSMLRDISMKIINSSGVEINISASTLQNMSFVTNASLKFENSNASSPWSIQLQGVDLAKTISMNLTGAFNATDTNTTGRTYLGMSGTKWQEMAQNLGADSIKLTIPNGGNSLIKCDEDNLTNCQDVTSQATLISGGMGHGNTTWEIPTSLGFSVYGTSTSGVVITSDKTTYKCYPDCTVYVNISNNNASVAGVMNLTINNTYTGSGVTFNNITYYNGTAWILSNRIDHTIFTDFNFTNDTTLQFRIQIAMGTPLGAKWTFNATITNASATQITRSFTDIAYLDSINLTTANNSLTTNQTPPLRFILYAFNDTAQNCTLHINSTDYTNSSVSNGTLVLLVATTRITNGTYLWNVSCTSSETLETDYSENRVIQVNDTTNPVLATISSNTPTSTAATITWSTDEPTNTSVNYGTATSLGTISGSTTFSTSKSVALSSLTSSTTYYYNTTSCDYVGRCTTNGSFTFATTASTTTTTTSSSGGGSGGTGTTASAKESFTGFSMQPGVTTAKTLTSTAIGFTNVAIVAKTAVSNVDLSVEKLSAKPSTAETPSGKVYQYIHVTTTIKDTDVSSIKIQFKVDKSWFTSSGVNENDVVLMRLTNSKWTELKTTKLSSGDSVTYEAESPGFSDYAIGQKASALTTTTTKTTANATKATNATEAAATTSETFEANQTTDEKKETTSKLTDITENKPLLYSLVIGIVVLAAMILFFMRKKGGGMGKSGQEKPLF